MLTATILKPYITAKKYILKLDGNALVCVAFHPLWGIPYSIYFFYLSIYMKAFGVTDTQLGLLMLAGSAASIVFSLAAAPVVDSLGRKRSTFLFDLISSAAPPFIYAISGSFWVSFIAIILNNANKIMSVAYYLVMAEDANNDQRLVAFNLFNIITIAAGIFIPVAGLFAGHFGLIGTERFFLVFAGISMTVLIFVRNRFLKETATGSEILANRKNKHFSFKNVTEPYAASYHYLAKHPAALVTVIANVIFYVYYIIGTNNSLYFATYFIDGLNLKQSSISVLGAVYAIGMLFAMIVINPFMQKFNIFVSLAAGSALNIAGLVLLIVIPSGSLLAAILSIIVTSVGFGVFKSYIDAALAITTEGKARAGIYSVVNLLSSLLGMLAAGLAGILYPLDPRSIYIMSIIMLFISILCFTAVLFRRSTYGKE